MEVICDCWDAMVYIDLSVISVEEAAAFYSEKLGIFTIQAGTRLICSIDIDLIIDLVECGTDEHRDIFGQDSHVVSSFWISPTDPLDENKKIHIFENLRKYGVEFRETANLGGHFLRFTDPSGNRFMLHANHGIID